MESVRIDFGDEDKRNETAELEQHCETDREDQPGVFALCAWERGEQREHIQRELRQFVKWPQLQHSGFAPLKICGIKERVGIVIGPRIDIHFFQVFVELFSGFNFQLCSDLRVNAFVPAKFKGEGESVGFVGAF